jgi:hypothetical protein
LGNLNTHSLKELWNGEKMVWIREMHRQGKRNEISACALCLTPQPIGILTFSSFIIGVFRSRTLLPILEKISTLYRFSLFHN